MNKIEAYMKLKEAYDELEYLVNPIVIEDIRTQRNKILEVMNTIRYDNLDNKIDALEKNDVTQWEKQRN